MKTKLKELLKNSYSPYSKFPVAAIVVTKSGQEFSGVNVENSSYGSTICAERVAIYNAITNGETQFKEIHILGNTKIAIKPCFACRQVLLEFFDEDAMVYLYGDKNETYQVQELCPHPFNLECEV